MRKMIYALLLAPAFAVATLGSVLSSFQLPSGGPPASLWVHYDGASVYALTTYWDAAEYSILRRYTTGGSVLNSYVCSSNLSGDCDRSHLGSNYIAVANFYGVVQVNKNTGSIVQSFTATGPGGSTATCVAWDGRYYWISSFGSRGEFKRYTPAGSLAGNWAASGWPGAARGTGGLAFAHRVLNHPGNYLVAANWEEGDPAVVINADTGSLVATFATAARFYCSAMYANSSRPTQYGAALWLCRRDYSGTWSWEVDLDARGGNTILPASLGRIKATYR